MSTRSYICKKNADNTYTYSYCHYDGYIDGVGQTLANVYNTTEKIDELLAYGDMSILGDFIQPKNPETHNFGYHKDANGNYQRNAEDNVCLFYHRDRGDDDCFHAPETDFNQLLGDGCICYVYLWDGQKWLVWGDKYEGAELIDALAQELTIAD